MTGEIENGDLAVRDVADLLQPQYAIITGECLQATRALARPLFFPPLIFYLLLLISPCSRCPRARYALFVLCWPRMHAVYKVCGGCTWTESERSACDLKCCVTRCLCDVSLLIIAHKRCVIICAFTTALSSAMKQMVSLAYILALHINFAEKRVVIILRVIVTLFLHLIPGCSPRIAWIVN